MKPDPILAEIRSVREAYAEKFSGNIQGMLDDLRKRQRQGSRKAVSRPPKRIAPSEETPADMGSSTVKMPG